MPNMIKCALQFDKLCIQVKYCGCQLGIYCDFEK